MIKSAKV